MEFDNNVEMISLAFWQIITIAGPLLTVALVVGLAIGISVMLMMIFKITHPPAGGNTIVVILAQDSFQFLVFPIMVGTITIIIGGIIYNRYILKKNYPLKWF